VLNVDGRTRSVPGTVTSLTVRGLRAGTVRVTVAAVNRVGSSTKARHTFTVRTDAAQAPRKALRIGMRTPAVAHLQAALGVPGARQVFDRRTRRAVTAWQVAHGLPATGVVNDRMRFLLAV
jgi:peptidoglycan hydrolase-like protein with peptidoglycan-binding domain